MTAPHLTRHHWARAASLDLPGLRKTVRAAEGFNAKVAVIVTHAVGTMACAYLFTLLALAGLPAALAPGGQGIIAWIAQTFIQLVLLSIIMVGQQVQSAASDARAEKQFADTEKILDAMDVSTAGGLRDVLTAIEAISPARVEPPDTH